MKPSLSIVCYDTLHPERSLLALQKAVEATRPEKVFWFSDKPLDVELSVPVVWTEIPTISKETFHRDTGRLYFEVIPSVVDTDFAMYVQSDGFPVNPEVWTDEFFDYDYVGAPWPFYDDGIGAVGNGGFSLRSRKFHEAVLKLKVAPSVYSILPEDTLLCRTYKREMEELGIQYAPVGLAMQFSMELPFEDERDVWIGCSFGFHGRFLCHHYGYTYDDLI